MLDNDNGSRDEGGVPLNNTTTASKTMEKDQNKSSGIKLCYLMGLATTVVLGSFQFGLLLGSWSILQIPYAGKADWTVDKDINDDGSGQFWTTMITVLQNLALVISAIVGPKFYKYGKRKTLLWNNVIILIGVVFSCIDGLWSLVLGRTIFGLGAGYFALACPNFLNEFVPTEYKGSFGSSVQFMCTFGIAFPSILVASVISSPPSPVTYTVQGVQFVTPEYSEWASSWAVQHFYQVIFALPAVFTLIQVGLFLFVFKYESPVYMKANEDWDGLREFMHLLYEDHLVNDRIEEIVVEDKQAKGVSMKQTFTDPLLKKAAWIAVFVAAFQQMSGINSIIFYSSTIFEKSGIDAIRGTLYVNVANFVSAIPPMFYLKYLGRRSVMLVCTFFMSIVLIMMGIATMKGTSATTDGDLDRAQTWNNIELIGTIFFVILFEFSAGPIAWLYIAEITNGQGASAATGVLQSLSLLQGAVTLYMFDGLGGYTFILFGMLTAINFLFVIFVMKETRGMSEAQVKMIYVSKVNRNNQRLTEETNANATEELLS